MLLVLGATAATLLWRRQHWLWPVPTGVHITQTAVAAAARQCIVRQDALLPRVGDPAWLYIHGENKRRLRKPAVRYLADQAGREGGTVGDYEWDGIAA